MRLRYRVLRALLIGALLGTLIGGILLAEVALHPERKALDMSPGIVASEAHRRHAAFAEASHTAADGAVLRGWYLQPEQWNRDAVLMLHGVSDNREGVLSFAPLFLD